MVKQRENGKLRLRLPWQREGGQILLIVILVVVVASTIGLSLASRSITNLRSSTEEAESQKALTAAEAGIERALQGNVAILNTPLDNNSNYNVKVDSIDGTTPFLLNGGNTILQDEGADVWLSDYSKDPGLIYNNPWNGDLTVYWGESATACNNSALEIIIISGPKNNPVSKRYAYDPCPARKNDNKFSVPSGGGQIGDKTFFYGITVNISQGLIARIIPIYGNTTGGIKGIGPALPSQGSVNTSTGTSGQASRKIRVFNGYPQTYLPYLSYGLFVAN